MLDPRAFHDLLTARGVEFFTGVPDSLLKDFLGYLADHTPVESNVIAANEGNAVALAAGHQLAAGRIGLVYMQNSGLGNAVNPLLSLADPDVYSIPMLLLIGWRGEPGTKDEPQHKKQGKVTTGLLDAMGIPWELLPDEVDMAAKALDRVLTAAEQSSSPSALLVRKGTFGKYRLKGGSLPESELAREAALRLVIEALPAGAIVVSTTGKTSRELFELREARGEDHSCDFLTVGSMGHSSQIALGLALAKPGRQVFCLDGDGALLMHAGGLAVIGSLRPANFRHVVFNNGAHDSVGGQPTCALAIDLTGLARAAGYRHAASASTSAEVRTGVAGLLVATGPGLLEIRVRRGARADLGRPTTSPQENKRAFVGFVRG